MNNDDGNTADFYYYHTAEPDIAKPTVEEIMYVIDNLKNNKASGSDSITTEMLKCGGNVLWEKIFKLIVLIWEVERNLEE